MKNKEYNNILNEISYLIENNTYDITILSNAAALLNMHMSLINWVGFYIYKDGILKLGPFQGKPACTEIPLDKGVCGACGKSMKTIIVEDVHKFIGHIACDSQSQSEICVPIIINNILYGLLDIDSPIIERFDEVDKENLEKIVDIIAKSLKNIWHYFIPLL